MIIEIKFEGIEDIKLTLETLEKMYKKSVVNYENQMKPNNEYLMTEALIECDVLQHLVVTLKCVSTQKIQIKWVGTFVNIGIDEKPYITFNTAANWSDGLTNNYSKLCELSKNDGFDTIKDFLKYFCKDFTGKIIHWTNKKY